MDLLTEALSDRDARAWQARDSRRKLRLEGIRAAKEHARAALFAADVVFKTFSEEELTTKGAHSDPYDEDPHFTSTTPFFTLRSGERVAVQQYFAERRVATPKESWLGRIGLAKDIALEKEPVHYALVFDAGYGETKEFARVRTRLKEDSYIGHYGQVPHQGSHEDSGTNEQDRRALLILNTMVASLEVNSRSLDLSF